MIYDYKQQRQKFILGEIKKHKSIQIKILSKKLNVTERTIRRDIKELAQTGLVYARYGRAVLISDKESPLYKNHQLYLHKNMEINTLNLFSPIMKTKGKVFILGSFNTDLVYRLNNFPASGETICAMHASCCPGGKGSNQAIASCMAGALTHFAAKLGNDDFATKALQFLSTVGLETLTLFTHPNISTGSAVVMISEEVGDNAIIINPGANHTITVDEIISCYEAIGECNVFLTQMENNPDATKLAIKFAHSSGITTIFNPAPWRKEVLDILPWAKVVTPNLTEAEAILSTSIKTENEIRNAAEAIYKIGPQIVIITLGSQGCWLFDGEQHRHFPAFPAVNIDTAGAGDAFNGALVAQLACGEKMATAILYASAFASLAVEREGASSMPEHQAVIKRMALSMD